MGNHKALRGVQTCTHHANVIHIIYAQSADILVAARWPENR